MLPLMGSFSMDSTGNDLCVINQSRETFKKFFFEVDENSKTFRQEM